MYKTPILGDLNGRKKKRGFKTPKLTQAAEERRIVAAKNAPKKKSATKSGFATPKKVRNRGAENLATNVPSDEELDVSDQPEAYF